MIKKYFAKKKKRFDFLLFVILSFSCNLIQSQISGEEVTDFDGNHYKTVVIGHQEWMRSNLVSTHYSNGDPIRLEVDSMDWVSSKDPIYTALYNRVEKNNGYGYLYNWYAVNDSRNICPTGWHVPTDFDWDVLEYLLNAGRNTGGKLKSTSWQDNAQKVVRDSHFDALPAGYIMMGMHGLDGIVGFWWTGSDFFEGVSYARYIQYDDNALYRALYDNNSGFSVRCIRN